MSLVYKDRTCDTCGVLYTPLNSNSKWCFSCREESRILAKRGYSKTYRLKNPKPSKPYPTGKDNKHYKNGIGYHKRRSRELKQELGVCNRCDISLIDAPPGQYCLHHIDYDRNNNEDNNFELLCKSCHAKEHGWLPK